MSVVRFSTRWAEYSKTINNSCLIHHTGFLYSSICSTFWFVKNIYQKRFIQIWSRKVYAQGKNSFGQYKENFNSSSTFILIQLHRCTCKWAKQCIMNIMFEAFDHVWLLTQHPRIQLKVYIPYTLRLLFDRPKFHTYQLRMKAWDYG